MKWVFLREWSEVDLYGNSETNKLANKFRFPQAEIYSCELTDEDEEELGFEIVMTVFGDPSETMDTVMVQLRDEAHGEPATFPLKVFLSEEWADGPNGYVVDVVKEYILRKRFVWAQEIWKQPQYIRVGDKVGVKMVQGNGSATLLSLFSDVWEWGTVVAVKSGEIEVEKLGSKERVSARWDNNDWVLKESGV